MISRNVVFISLVCVISLFRVSAVAAHPTEPRLEISSDRVIPGTVLDVRGVAFDYEDVVTLTLLGPAGDLYSWEINANLEGEFLYTMALPPDLMEGTYYFRGVTDHHYTLSPPITVWGTALSEGGGQGPRDDADGLLAPMPTYAPGVVPGGVVPTQAEAVSVETPPETASGLNANIWILAGMLILVALLVAGFMKRNT